MKNAIKCQGRKIVSVARGVTVKSMISDQLIGSWDWKGGVVSGFCLRRASIVNSDHSCSFSAAHRLKQLALALSFMRCFLLFAPTATRVFS